MPTPAEQLKHLKLTVYSATWCPDCTRLNQWLKEAGIEPAYVDIESDPAAAERLERETGKRAIPFILVNEKTWVRGYHKELPRRLDPDLLVSELLAAAG
jgi:glutaredoxin